MDAKAIYLSIMRVIHVYEQNLPANQELKVYLLDFPELEVITIGRSGDEYLYFKVHHPEGIDTILLLPAVPQPLRIDIVDRPDSGVPSPRKTIGFLGNVADKK
jgi:hypothetical protein